MRAALMRGRNLLVSHISANRIQQFFRVAHCRARMAPEQPSTAPEMALMKHQESSG